MTNTTETAQTISPQTAAYHARMQELRAELTVGDYRAQAQERFDTIGLPRLGNEVR